MTGGTSRAQRALGCVFVVGALLWLAGAGAIVAWHVIHPPVTLHGTKK